MAAPNAAVISLRLATAGALFHTLDPTPFREGDLAAEAEDYILDWARDLPRDQPFAILVRLPAAELANPLARIMPHAVPAYFARRAEGQTRAIRDLMQRGRIALALGLGILAACLVLAGRAVVLVPGVALPRVLAAAPVRVLAEDAAPG